MNSITKRVDDEAKYSDLPASYHSGTLMMPILVKTSGSSMPATPNIAHRPFTSSACTNHLRFSGSSASPRGSNPLSPGRLQQGQISVFDVSVRVSVGRRKTPSKEFK